MTLLQNELATGGLFVLFSAIAIYLAMQDAQKQKEMNRERQAKEREHEQSNSTVD